MISLGAENRQIGALLILKYHLASDSNLKFGCYTNSELFGPFMVPLIGYYHKSERHEINILAPLAANYQYQLTRGWNMGLDFRGIIKSYQLRGMEYLTKANNEIGVVSNLQAGKILFRTIIGSTIGRNFRTYNDHDQLDFGISAIKIGDERVQTNQDISNGLFIKSSLIIRFPTGV